MALIAVVWVATLPATAHETDEDGETYTVLQDGECVTIAPFGDEDETVTEFYDYRTLHEDNPYHNTTGGRTVRRGRPPSSVRTRASSSCTRTGRTTT